MLPGFVSTEEQQTIVNYFCMAPFSLGDFTSEHYMMEATWTKEPVFFLSQGVFKIDGLPNHTSTLITQAARRPFYLGQVLSNY